VVKVIVNGENRESEAIIFNKNLLIAIRKRQERMGLNNFVFIMDFSKFIFLLLCSLINDDITKN